MQYVITVHTQHNPASHWLAWWQPRGALVILAFEALQQLFRVAGQVCGSWHVKMGAGCGSQAQRAVVCEKLVQESQL